MIKIYHRGRLSLSLIVARPKWGQASGDCEGKEGVKTDRGRVVCLPGLCFSFAVFMNANNFFYFSIKYRFIMTFPFHFSRRIRLLFCFAVGSAFNDF